MSPTLGRGQEVPVLVLVPVLMLVLVSVLMLVLVSVRRQGCQTCAPEGPA